MDRPSGCLQVRAGCLRLGKATWSGHRAKGLVGFETQSRGGVSKWILASAGIKYETSSNGVQKASPAWNKDVDSL